ncbi:MAG: hypothetical protein ABIO70_18940 [Pseudomonadota bacterium]
MEEIPFDRLSIPNDLRADLDPDAPLAKRLAAAQGLPDLPVGSQLGICIALSQDPSAEVRAAAAATVRNMPERRLMEGLGQSSATAVLDLVVFGREGSAALDGLLITLRNLGDGAAVRIGERADEDLCERIAFNRERLLMTPRVYVALHGNEACPDKILEKAAAFLRMNRMLPEVPAARPFAAPLAGGAGAAQPAAGGLGMFDLDDVAGPDDDLFHGLDFEFSDDMSNFSWEMTDDRDGLSDEEIQNLEKQVAGMTVGQRVRLAHVGNKQIRGMLLRDRNKQVSMAVVKSGRMTDGEVTSLASNRNIEDEVLREVATNREWIRKYPVQVALVGNPKTPVSVAVRLVGYLQKRDLQELSRNHNVSSVVRQTALRLFKQKYRSEGGDKKKT